jgi:hypothetical protein
VAATSRHARIYRLLDGRGVIRRAIALRAEVQPIVNARMTGVVCENIGRGRQQQRGAQKG